MTSFFIGGVEISIFIAIGLPSEDAINPLFMHLYFNNALSPMSDEDIFSAEIDAE